MASNLVIFRKKVFDPLKQTWMDEAIPTVTTKRHGWVRSATAATVLASHYVLPGSPITVQRSWMILRLRAFSGSPETRFSIVHSRLGTIDQIYFESPGEETNISAGMPIYALHTGTVKAYLHTPGSAYSGYGVSLEGPEA